MDVAPLVARWAQMKGGGGGGGALGCHGHGSVGSALGSDEGAPGWIPSAASVPISSFHKYHFVIYN